MSEFSLNISRARRSMGFSSAKKFFEQKLRPLEVCNYSHFMRIEKGLVLPSAELFNALIQIYPLNERAALVYSYCKTLLPQFASYFPESSPSLASTDSTKMNLSKRHHAGISLNQVSLISQTASTYHLFLLLTLARKPIAIKELKKLIGGEDFESAVATLVETKLVILQNNELSCVTNDFKFPAAKNALLKGKYLQMDEWDHVFGEKLGLTTILNKTMIRRISLRHKALVEKHLELLFDLIRSADETDSFFNDQVLQIKCQVRIGQLPG